jgi:hypothetical protein
MMAAALMPVTMLILSAAPAEAQPGPAADVQSLLLRAVTVTYDLDRSLLFYRDILG